MEASEEGKEKTIELKGGVGGRGQARRMYRMNKRRRGRTGGRVRKERRRRRDRPEFVQLGESVSSGITSQNGQTQTEDRKMDVRGCTKGKGGAEKKRKEEGRVTPSP